MNLRDFARHIQKKSTAVLLHRARKASLKRILAHEETLEASCGATRGRSLLSVFDNRGITLNVLS